MFYYCVLKLYKGLFRKKHKGNLHNFAIPIDENSFLFLALIGEFEKISTPSKQTYACTLINKIPTMIQEDFIQKQVEYFKGRFEVLDSLSCNTKKVGHKDYIISFPRNGDYVKSNLSLTFIPEMSTKRDYYRLVGDIHLFEIEPVNPGNLRMVSLKKMAFIKSLQKNR